MAASLARWRPVASVQTSLVEMFVARKAWNNVRGVLGELGGATTGVHFLVSSCPLLHGTIKMEHVGASDLEALDNGVVLLTDDAVAVGAALKARLGAERAPES